MTCPEPRCLFEPERMDDGHEPQPWEMEPELGEDCLRDEYNEDEEELT